MIDQIKPKNLGTDLNNNKVTSESVTNKVSDAKVSKVSHPTTDVESNNGKVSQFISKEKVKKWQVNHLLIRQLLQELKLQ